MVQILSAKMSYNDMEILAAVSLLSSEYYKTPEQKVRVAKKYLSQIKRELPNRFAAAMARVKSSGGVAGESGDNFWGKGFGNTTQKSYVNDNIASKPSDRIYNKQPDTSQYTETVEACKQNFLNNHPGTDPSVVEDYCQQEFGDGGPMKYGSKIVKIVGHDGKFIGFAIRKVKQASITSNKRPAYLVTHDLVAKHDDLPKSTRSIKSGSVEEYIGAKQVIRDAVIRRDSTTLNLRDNNSNIKSAKKVDNRPAYLVCAENTRRNVMGLGE